MMWQVGPWRLTTPIGFTEQACIIQCLHDASGRLLPAKLDRQVLQVHAKVNSGKFGGVRAAAVPSKPKSTAPGFTGMNADAS